MAWAFSPCPPFRRLLRLLVILLTGVLTTGCIAVTSIAALEATIAFTTAAAVATTHYNLTKEDVPQVSSRPYASHLAGMRSVTAVSVSRAPSAEDAELLARAEAGKICAASDRVPMIEKSRGWQEGGGGIRVKAGIYSHSIDTRCIEADADTLAEWNAVITQGENLRKAVDPWYAREVELATEWAARSGDWRGHLGADGSDPSLASGTGPALTAHVRGAHTPEDARLAARAVAGRTCLERSMVPVVESDEASGDEYRLFPWSKSGTFAHDMVFRCATADEEAIERERASIVMAEAAGIRLERDGGLVEARAEDECIWDDPDYAAFMQQFNVHSVPTSCR